MPKVKVPRKSTSIDMTAMCDVAFLLLSFFILTTKFKPSETLAVQTPSSVASKVAPQKDVTLVTIDKEGKVFLSWSEDAPKSDIIEALNTNRNLGLTDGEMKALAKGPFIGVPLAQLKSLAAQPADNWPKMKLPGIPVLDSANNEMVDWMRAIKQGFTGIKMNLLVKGDNASKYPAFKGVIDAFKKNDEMKFQMVTNPEGVPAGTELYRKNMSGQAKAEE
ncbi:biopolymer transporter ExbD [Flavihumibacter rivuli]|uniref:ExbD/TolR family protein n=1 Tax=Flavihumibacter rivuli TaxID=2838156 RepID=UPI001BDEB769|nr:biopolymer transporter ExbD [Flavihumibacter rivuli]ULQ58336.1 biopolymer transporter ExbD [Flavihumibacter rivuli]